MPSDSSSSGSGLSALAVRNSVAINTDVCRQLAQAPFDLKNIFRTEGFDGVSRWVVRWADLCDTVLRVHAFGLMAETTRQQALIACNRCLAIGIPGVDALDAEVARIREVLDPYNAFPTNTLSIP
ncbi:uncharacterized protein EI90DRAFT_3013415 [Cantharellus anzutake]|uniref:uncharacterized protein n=1 Tax=Cantharellus anzutake TaxID=1750568 RepID=UPI0019072030|nr:uncharacterized protein EI90DRAFT_3013415 [Cantharellus anzutake]KAF8338105.1 hypothetical protein EI90DRAFT_3013415 [Cantharellus anzutake]